MVLKKKFIVTIMLIIAMSMFIMGFVYEQPLEKDNFIEDDRINNAMISFREYLKTSPMKYEKFTISFKNIYTFRPDLSFYEFRESK